MCNGGWRMAGNKYARITMNRFPELRARMHAAVGREVRLATLDLLSQAVRRAPVEEGILRGSGTAHFNGARIASGRDFDSSSTGDEGVQGGHETTPTTGVVAFNTVYAIAQHERTDYAHPKGGEAKYLERPLNENVDRYEQRIARAARTVLGGRG